MPVEVAMPEPFAVIVEIRWDEKAGLSGNCRMDVRPLQTIDPDMRVSLHNRETNATSKTLRQMVASFEYYGVHKRSLYLWSYPQILLSGYFFRECSAHWSLAPVRQAHLRVFTEVVLVG
jgi:hypothetical protein